jgi:hypothetical protein
LGHSAGAGAGVCGVLTKKPFTTRRHGVTDKSKSKFLVADFREATRIDLFFSLLIRVNPCTSVTVFSLCLRVSPW